MLFSSAGFFFIVAITALPLGGLVYWVLNKKEVSFNISAGVGALVAVALGVYIFTIKTDVLVINEDNTEHRSMIGTADFEFMNGESETIPKLGHGQVIVNNTSEECILKRFDYDEDISEDDKELMSIALLINPQSFFSFHGKKVEYLFEESPEYLEFDQNASKSTMVKFELHYLETEDWDTYYVYDGPVVYGVPEGEGTFYFSPDNNYYKGTLVNAKFQGKGKMVYDEFEWYEGDFVDDHRTGEGFYRYSDSSTYQGGWLEDKKDGYGIRKYANGHVYEGDYLNGEMHGDGKYTFDDGDYYEGEFEDGYFQGKGKWYYADTDTFKEGNWYEDDYIGE